MTFHGYKTGLIFIYMSLFTVENHTFTKITTLLKKKKRHPKDANQFVLSCSVLVLFKLDALNLEDILRVRGGQ